jgi:type II secretory pathway component GspD/PulD (secretin)
LKVQFVLSRYQGEKKVGSTPYMLGVLSGGQKTSLRVGTQVPVVMTVFGSKSEGGLATIPQQSYSYRDVGTNIDCQAQSVGNGLFSLTVTVEDSSIHADRSSNTAEQKQVLRDIPSFRSFRASFAIMLREGQTMQYASATDPISGEVMRIDVTLTLAK